MAGGWCRVSKSDTTGESTVNGRVGHEKQNGPTGESDKTGESDTTGGWDTTGELDTTGKSDRRASQTRRAICRTQRASWARRASPDTTGELTADSICESPAKGPAQARVHEGGGALPSALEDGHITHFVMDALLTRTSHQDQWVSKVQSARKTRLS